MKTTKKPHTAPAHIMRPARLKVQTQAESELSARKAEHRASALARAVNVRATPRLTAFGSYTPKGYNGAELKPYAARPGTEQVHALPSRIGNRLCYPDGRVTDMAGNLLDDTWSKS